MLKNIFPLNLVMAKSILATLFLGIDDTPSWRLPSGYSIELVKELQLKLP